MIYLFLCVFLIAVGWWTHDRLALNLARAKVSFYETQLLCIQAALEEISVMSQSGPIYTLAEKTLTRMEVTY